MHRQECIDVTGINPCNPDSTPIDPGGGADALSANATSWMTSNTVSTDIVNDPDASATLIQAAAADPDAALAIDGSTLQAINLTATTVSGDPVPVSYAAVSDDTLAWISDFTAASTAYAATLDPTDNARRLLLGTPCTVDEMQDWVRRWSATHARLATTFQLKATFGRYGVIPLVGAYIIEPDTGDACLELVDGISGRVDGPFVSTDPLSADELLASHSQDYIAGSAYKLTSAATDCPILAAPYPPPVSHPALPTWRAILPGHWIPQPPRISDPPGTVPGRPTLWGCISTTNAAGLTSCTCTRTVYLSIGNVDPAQPLTVPILIPEVQTCITPGECGANPTSPTIALPGGCSNAFWY